MDLDLRRWRTPKFPQEVALDLDSDIIVVKVRVHARARRYRLSLSARNGPVLTVPHKGRWSDAEAFLMRHKGWLADKISKRATGAGMADGATLALRGQLHRIVAETSARGIVRIGPAEDRDGLPVLRVPGGPEHLERRLTDWLKAQARSDLETRCAIHAERLGVKIASLRIRDQSTRWGSCSSARVLNFNWRLILAPPYVLDYVAAHEVAHILEMNHSPAFWRTVARTLPDYERGKAWLKAHGSGLMTI